MIGRRASREDRILSHFAPPIVIDRPRELTTPVIFASPHSGNIYPDIFVSAALPPINILRRNEDAFIDQLFACVTDYGAPLLSARFPRSLVDVNRAPDELPRRWRQSKILSTPRAEMGLGVIPTMISEHQPIYRRQPPRTIIQSRMRSLYHPYHDALSELISDAAARFDRALLVDCHSMPGFTAQGSRRADIILGDRYGVSCEPETLSMIDSLFSKRGYNVTRNYPYAGGYVAAHYGRPQNGIEAIQIEINRDLYLNPVTLKRKPGYKRLEADIADIARELIDCFSERLALAAE